MSRANYIKLLLIAGIFVSVNLIPSSGWAEEGSADVSLSLYPEAPNNATLLNTDTTLTLQVQNKGTVSKEFRYRISGRSENLFVNGRDGIKLPAQEKVGGKENYYQSFALIPLNPNQDSLVLEVTLMDVENNFLASENFSLEVFKPNLDADDLGSKIATESELSSNADIFLVPRYRRYWHPERNEVGKAASGYVWLAVAGERNILIDDESGEVIERNLTLPWDVSPPDRGRAKLWNGSDFEEKYIPTTKVGGDNSYNRERFELYFAAKENRPAWITRRIFYWTSENFVGGSLDEIPDTERVELWVEAENGESLFMVSDYHHYAFRYDPVESYTIQTHYHSPLPLDGPLLWSDFTLGNYSGVYQLSEIKHDHLGFSKRVHPVDRVLEEKKPPLKRNLVGAGLAALVLIVPYVWDRKIGKSP